MVGRHRGRPGGVVRLVVPGRVLTRMRVEGVYSPMVWQAMVRPWGRPEETWENRTDLWESRESAERYVASWLADHAAEGRPEDG